MSLSITEKKLLRDSIIWCDSRAVDIGKQAFKDLTKERCVSSLLNSPANFTASKLKWVKDNEPELLTYWINTHEKCRTGRAKSKGINNA